MMLGSSQQRLPDPGFALTAGREGGRCVQGW